MSLPRYERYKDSGMKWLREVPEHWSVGVLTRISSRVVVGIAEAATHAYSDEGVAILRSTNIRPGRIIGDILKIDSDFSEGRDTKVIHSGDLVTVRTGNAGVTAVIPSDLDGCQCFTMLITTLTSDANSEFYCYFINTSLAQSYFSIEGWGTAQVNISVPILKALPVVIPPLSEQRSIVTFLDRETAKIDEAIAEQQHLIDLLKEKRQSIISHAVTKGLDANVPAQNSGIEWLGMMPKHWTLIPLKRLCSLLKDGTHLPPARVEQGIPLLSVRNIVNDCFTLREDDSMISEEDYKKLCQTFTPQANDVVLAIVGATLGKTAIIPDELGAFHIQRSLAIFRTIPEKITQQFLHLVFQSIHFQTLLWKQVGYSAQPGVYLGSLENICLPVPPLQEQITLINKVEKSLGDLAISISEAEHTIDLLQERRISLISAAVTGKIDVRRFVE